MSMNPFAPAALALCIVADAGAQIHVAPTGNDAGAGTASSPFRTINHAAAVAAPGSTIYLRAGVYGNEQGIVQLGTKDLVLQGDGAATTILLPHSSLTLPLVPVGAGAAVAVPHRTGLLLSGTARIHVRSLTIDAQSVAPAAGELAGIYLRGGVDVVCDHVVVRNCRPAVPGATPANAIAVRGDVPANPTSLVVRDGALVNFGSSAIRATLRAEIDVQECDIAGPTPYLGSGDQVGVWLQNVAQGSIRLSRITDCGGAGGTAVRLDQHGSGCLVEGNRIARAAIGVDVRHTPPQIVPGNIRNNRIAAVDTTVAVRGVAGVLVTGNALFPVSRFDPMPYWDDTAGLNVWAQNRYGVLPTATSVAIPGGGNVDLAPVSSLSELGGLERIVCGGAPVAVVSADFDADGRLDFATLDLVGGGVGLTVGLWRPTGHVTSTLSFGGAGLRPVALATGEFDGAPGVDLVALTAPLPPAAAGAAFWVFGNDGAGGISLLHQQPLPNHIAPAGVAAARLDSDFQDDVAIVDRGAWPFVAGRAEVFLNIGKGAAWAAAALPVTFTEAVMAVAAGDVDDDGNHDLVLAEGSPGSGRVHWLRGSGFGSFVASLGSPFSVPANPAQVLIADFDADGDRDLLVASVGGALPFQRGALKVFENRPSLLFSAPPQPIEGGPARLCKADLDGDASPGQLRPELLVAHPSAGRVTLFGAWEPATGFAGGGAMSLVAGPVDLVAGDFDGDPYHDLIVAEPDRGGIALLHGSPTAQVTTFGPGCPGTAGREPRLETRGLPGLPTQPNPGFEIVVVDAFPLSIAACAVALGPGPVAVPCGYLLDVPLFILGTLTDSNGRGAFGLPLPALPDARGFSFCLQAGVYDLAASSFLPEISLTAGLCLRVGD
jgi:hypothetical protein